MPPHPNHPVHYTRAATVASRPGDVLFSRWRLKSLLEITPLFQRWSGFDVREGSEVEIVFPDIARAPQIRTMRQTMAALDAAGRAAAIQHPNVLVPCAVGVTRAEECAFVMPALEGSTAADLLATSGAMAPARAVKLIMDVLEGLEAAHAANVIHRCISPRAIGVVAADTLHERAVLRDFAVGATMEGGSWGRIQRDPRANFCYHAPETLHHGVIARSTDLYQVALTLAELILGRPLLTEPTVYAVARRYTQGRLVLPARIASSPLGPILRRALHPEPARRYITARQLLQALAEALDLLQASAFSLHTSYESQETLRRRSLSAAQRMIHSEVGVRALPSGGHVVHHRANTSGLTQPAVGRTSSPTSRRSPSGERLPSAVLP